MSSFVPTPEQERAIEYDGDMVITACPGSGKTTVVKEKIRNVVAGLPDYKGVAAITFTKKASKELEKRCKQDAHDTKQSFFGTIDSFCLKEIIIPFLSRIWGGNPESCKIIKRLSDPYARFLEQEYRAPTVEEIVNDQGFRRLYDSGILWMNSFAALALHVLSSTVSAQRYIRARYSYIFVDEYQDSSNAQHQLLINLMELGLTTVVVGDVSQSIYEFRGGNPELLNSLRDDSEHLEHFEINVNYRSHPSIVNYASRLIDSNFELMPYNEIRVFRRVIEGNLTNAAQKISGWISEWIGGGEWDIERAADVAILARKERSLRLLAEGLEVNYRMYSGTPLDEIGSDCSGFYASLLGFKYGLISTIQELITTEFGHVIDHYSGLGTLRRSIASIRELDEPDDLIVKFRELAYLLDIEVEQSSEDAVREVLRHEEFVKQFRPLNEDEVQVMTLHKAKGLEFRVVFHFDLEDWSFPFKEVIGGDWDNPRYPSLEQDTNLHYVGITRAENCCILIRTTLRQNRHGNFKQSAPSYFFNLPQLEGLYR